MSKRYGIRRHYIIVLLALLAAAIAPLASSKTTARPATQGQRKAALADAIRTVEEKSPLAPSETALQKLVSNDPGGDDRDFFGQDVAIDGDTAVVGAYRERTGLYRMGAVHVFVWNGSNWLHQQKLSPPPTSSGMDFGFSVAISGDTIVIGAPSYNDGAALVLCGAVYFFHRSGSTWTETQRVLASDRQSSDYFGRDVAISGDTAIVGSDAHPVNITQPGSAYFFQRTGGVWAEGQKVTHGGNTNDLFGYSVSIEQDTAVISFPRFGNATGGARVYERNGSIWSPTASILPNQPDQGCFGESTSISGDLLLVGAPCSQPGSVGGAGYVFAKTTGAGWQQEAKLTAPDAVSGDGLGIAADIDGDRAILGAWFNNGERGAAYTFRRCLTDWGFEEKLVAADGAPGDPGDHFGRGVGVFGNKVIMGSPRADIGGIEDQGAAYAGAIQPPARGEQCDISIIVNRTTDESDDDIQDDVCDIDENTLEHECTLRAAIETANARAGRDIISFNISGSGVHTISPGSTLPLVDEAATIDATTQPGYAGTPLIQLSGGAQGVNPGLGLLPNSGDSSIKGLAIYGFETNISMQGSGASIESSYLGLRADGTAPPGSQQQYGVVLVNGAANNTIGGTDAADGNVIGSLFVGIGIYNGSPSNRVLNNKIGTDPTGAARRTLEAGVVVNGSNGNRVGQAGDGNLISGGTFAGVNIFSSSSTIVQGNRIGTNATGTDMIDNLHGITVNGGGNNTIGGPTVADGNLISGNSRYGLVVFNGSANNQVINNSVGTTDNGTGVLGNYLAGIAIEGGANNNTIEKNVVGGQNEIKTSTGIFFTNSAGANNTAKGNFIGVARDGTTAIPNEIGLETASDGQIIGTQGNANLFCHNTVGVNIRTGPSDPGTSGNLVQYNLFGTDGTVLIGQQSSAVVLYGDSSENIVRSNTIGATYVGVEIIDGPHDNVITDNKIGNNGTVPLDNGIGVAIEYAENNRIENNVLSGNDIGVNIGLEKNVEKGRHREARVVQRERAAGVPGYATGNSLSGNIIGLNAAQSAPISNYTGVWIGQDARSNLIGTATGDRNVIAGNESDGVFIGTLAGNPSQSVRPRDNLVQRNLIGVDATKAVPFPNGIAVTLAQTSGNVIGGATEDLGNTIVASTSDGIRVADADDNTIINNLIGTIEGPGRGDGLTGTDGPEFGNGGSGIKILGKSIKNKIFKNVIGHSGMNGIEVDCPTAPASTEPQTQIAGNHIGVVLNQTGTAARNIRNLAAGILIKNTANVQIGDVGADAGNVIGNNLQHGIHVTGSPTVAVPPIFVDGGTPFATRVVNNALGVIKKTNGENIPAGNGFNGLLGENTAGLLVGGDTQALANKVMANARAGLLFKNVQPSGIQTIAARAKANLIGALIENGQLTTNLGNNGGVEIENSTTVEIGTENQNEARNLIASNLLHGVKSLTSRLVKVAGNNVLKNAGHALLLRQTNESSVVGNGIGIDIGALIANGGNTGDGIVVEDSEDVTIGDSNAGNVVAGNQGDGIKLIQARLTKLQANLVGLYEQKSEYHRLGNKNGVVMIDSENCEIGGLDDLKSNIIAANQEYGMLMDQLTQIMTVQNNMVGTIVRNIHDRLAPEPTDGGTNFGNGLGGIRISTGSNTNVIGGAEPNSRNFIANNGGPGVWVNPTAGLGNWVYQNAIYSNTGQGIELGAIGQDANDPMDADAGPNNLQNYPEIVSLTLNGQGELIATYKVDSAPENSTYGNDGLYIEFFEADPMGAGRVLLGTDRYLLSDYNNGMPGTRTKNLGTPAALGLEEGDKLTMSTSDDAGNTSEFAPAVLVPVGGGTPTPTPSGTPTPTPSPSPGGTPLYTRGDYDGDNKTDLTVWRPSAFAAPNDNLSAFYTFRSTDASFFGIQFGNTGDVAIAGDFDGDNKTDFGVSRYNTSPGGVDLVYLESSTNTAKFPVWGNAGDIFISGDYDGDHKTDVMAWRPSDGTWYTVNSSGANGGFSFITHGQSGDKPYAMDTDGDGKSNLVYFRPATGDWVVRNNDGSTTTTNFGLSTDIPVPADYDGDNKDDIAVFRDGMWIVLRSSNGQVEFMPFGTAGDIPIPGDYDGDNKYDRAVYRQGIWHMLRSSQGYTGFQFGAPTDTAMPKAYIP